jgi:hypothetical protein
MASEFSALLDDDAAAAAPATGVLAYLNQFKDRPAELQQAEHEYYGTPNTEPGFVPYNSPASMPTDVYQGLLQALKPTPLGTGIGGSTLEPAMQAKILNRDIQNQKEEFDSNMADLEDQTYQVMLQDYLSQQRQQRFSTITMDINGEQWEVPTDVPGLTEDDLRPWIGTDPSEWPPKILDIIENRARDNLERGYDPFGNPLSQDEDTQFNPSQPYSEPTPLPGT